MKTIALFAMLLVQGIPAQVDKGIVTGRVLAVDGMPASGIRVAALAVPEAGTAAANSGAMLSIAETDKDGRYRLENIPPGRYYITAGLVGSPTYFPRSLTPDGATEVQILSGKTIDKMDFTMLVPAGLKVSGRLTVKTASSAPVMTLTSPLIGAIETTVQPDGTFQFPKVLPGSYTLQPLLGLQPMPIRVTDHDITNIELGGGPGVSVTGKIVIPGTPAIAMAPQTITLFGATNFTSIGVAATGVAGGVVGGVVGGSAVTSGSINPLSTRTNADGTFEFLKVPPGAYTVRVIAAGPVTQQPALVVADKNITGLQIRVPYSADVAGRLMMEDGSRFQIPNYQVGIEARYSNGTIGNSVGADGSFRFRLSEGSYQIGLRSLPLGYVVKSIVSGDTNVLASSLKIAPGDAVKDVLVTVATVPLDSIKGVKFSGRIVGLPPASASIARVTLNGTDAGAYTLETKPNVDGTFEFAKVPPGNYLPRITGIPNASPTGPIGPPLRVYVGEDNVTGFQIPLSMRTPIAGRITVVDADGHPLPNVTLSGSVNFRRPNGSFGTTIAPDGTFRISLDDGDQTLSFDRLPPQFTIQAMTAGSVDLMKVPLNVDHNTTIPEIQVRIVFRP